MQTYFWQKYKEYSFKIEIKINNIIQKLKVKAVILLKEIGWSLLQLLWKLLNVISLGQRETDSNNPIITLTRYFYIVIFSNELNNGAVKS